MILPKNTLYYIHDPMCSWCWGFNKTWKKVQKLLPNSINVYYVLGGLAPDSSEVMPNEMREYVQANWKKIQEKIPNTEFNYDFWKECTPIRATYPACRAVIACKNQNPELEIKMINLIQQAYYLEARNPSKDSTLIELASTLNLNIEQFTRDLNTKVTQQKLLDDTTLAKSLSINGFPSLVLRKNNSIQHIKIDYNQPKSIINQIIT